MRPTVIYFVCTVTVRIVSISKYHPKHPWAAFFSQIVTLFMSQEAKIKLLFQTKRQNSRELHFLREIQWVIQQLQCYVTIDKSTKITQHTVSRETGVRNNLSAQKRNWSKSFSFKFLLFWALHLLILIYDPLKFSAIRIYLPTVTLRKKNLI